MRRLVLIAGFVLLTVLPCSARETVVVTEGEVRQVVTDFLRKRTANLGVELNVKKLGYGGGVRVPKGETSFEVIAPRQWEGWGKGNLALIIRVDERVERNLQLPVEVEALADVVVAARPLDRGEVLGIGDVVLQKRDLAAVNGKWYRQPEDVVGKRVRTAVRVNSPMRPEHLEKVPLVKSGQTVTILLENDLLRLTSTGRVKNAGAEGDVVLVQNLVSQKEIQARVVDSQTVKVDF
ncbi:flagellar basal body P-ring formation chaperone FlgA [Geobacter sp. DSM 9736]|uniref:flagellar basal body P-ring formation chaperone FlgA n=1 Tax=Geobacter sp. DSM 9736 TaxID=1277350 RepID=UPI000B512C8F|nr:flagellar basal body P-ring formation chaperone FlgA [Geobacter sp. DSM 9736]SNB47038.1 flagella basal body P-ring formation protein FlgA [Geobacter sp. DSM 9736]